MSHSHDWTIDERNHGRCRGCGLERDFPRFWECSVTRGTISSLSHRVEMQDLVERTQIALEMVWEGTR